MIQFSGFSIEEVIKPEKFSGISFWSQENPITFNKLTIEQVPNHLLKLSALSVEEHTVTNKNNNNFSFTGV